MGAENGVAEEDSIALHLVGTFYRLELREGARVLSFSLAGVLPIFHSCVHPTV